MGYYLMASSDWTTSSGTPSKFAAELVSEKNLQRTTLMRRHGWDVRAWR